MNLAAILISTPLDARQVIRLRRFVFATPISALTAALAAIAWLFGMPPASVMLGVAIAYLAINLGVYVAIRAGFNLRFKDPSLTLFQMLAAITAPSG